MIIDFDNALKNTLMTTRLHELEEAQDYMSRLISVLVVKLGGKTLITPDDIAALNGKMLSCVPMDESDATLGAMYSVVDSTEEDDDAEA